jgi:hypothetical protein
VLQIQEPGPEAVVGDRARVAQHDARPRPGGARGVRRDVVRGVFRAVQAPRRAGSGRDRARCRRRDLGCAPPPSTSCPRSSQPNIGVVDITACLARLRVRYSHLAADQLVRRRDVPGLIGHRTARRSPSPRSPGSVVTSSPSFWRCYRSSRTTPATCSWPRSAATRPVRPRSRASYPSTMSRSKLACKKTKEGFTHRDGRRGGV